MKLLKRTIMVILLLPVILAALYIVIEIAGMCVNHMTTDRQTTEMQKMLSASVSDIDISDTNSWTGNTGNGNHVECVSEITFSSELTNEELANAFAEKYGKNVRDRGEGEDGCYFVDFDEDGISTVRFTKEESGSCLCRLVTSAPFSDNIEGH